MPTAQQTRFLHWHRALPGSTGRGRYFHVAVRPKEEFVTFRAHDVGRPGHIQRVAGKRRSGSWDTQKWLISKSDAHMESGQLVPDTAGARKVLGQLGSVTHRAQGDRFTAQPRRNVPGSAKRTPAMRRAQTRTIRKAQAARRKRS